MNKESESTRGRSEGSREREQSGGISNKSHEVAEQARQVAMERVDSVRQSTESAKQKAADRFRKLGAAVRKVGEHLRVEDQNYIAEKAATASQQLESFANYIDDAEISTLVRDTGTLARTSPAAFFGSAFVVGLAAGRFLKAGSGTSVAVSSRARARR